MPSSESKYLQNVRVFVFSAFGSSTLSTSLVEELVGRSSLGAGDFILDGLITFTAQKMKFSIKDFFNKRDQTRRKLWIWSHLLQKSLIENFIFCGAKNEIITSLFLIITPSNKFFPHDPNYIFVIWMWWQFSYRRTS